MPENSESSSHHQDRPHRSQRSRRNGKHHEIYLNDLRRAAPEKWKTIVRQPPVHDAAGVRIEQVPGGETKKTGPYRLRPHPNYLVVTLEFIVLPLLMQAPYTLALFFPLNLLVLRQRIRLEEKALREFTDYSEKFPA